METEGSLPQSQVPATCPYPSVILPSYSCLQLIYNLDTWGWRSPYQNLFTESLSLIFAKVRNETLHNMH
jgi:hypothetical protein